MLFARAFRSGPTAAFCLLAVLEHRRTTAGAFSRILAHWSSSWVVLRRAGCLLRVECLTHATYRYDEGVLLNRLLPRSVTS